jgi:hypothetical protein
MPECGKRQVQAVVFKGKYCMMDVEVDGDNGSWRIKAYKWRHDSNGPW